jgi:membrane-associated HD superfamily phosphohydrolase
MNMKQIIQFLDVVFTGVVAGIIFGVWIGYDPRDLSAVTYVEQQQNAIHSLNVLMPILGLISILLTVVNAVMCKREKLKRNLLIIAAILLIVSGLITRFGNQPINAIVIAWDLEAIPETWTVLRDKWWSFHSMRTLSAMMAFVLIAWTTIINFDRLDNRIMK